MGDIADDAIDAGLGQLLLHYADRCEEDCPYCAEEDADADE